MRKLTILIAMLMATSVWAIDELELRLKSGCPECKDLSCKADFDYKKRTATREYIFTVDVEDKYFLYTDFESELANPILLYPLEKGELWVRDNSLTLVGFGNLNRETLVLSMPHPLNSPISPYDNYIYKCEIITRANAVVTSLDLMHEQMNLKIRKKKRLQEKNKI